MSLNDNLGSLIFDAAFLPSIEEVIADIYYSMLFVSFFICGVNTSEVV
jgi:hypothetical protein